MQGRAWWRNLAQLASPETCRGPGRKVLYSSWLQEQSCEWSMLSLKDWLIEEVTNLSGCHRGPCYMAQWENKRQMVGRSQTEITSETIVWTYKQFWQTILMYDEGWWLAQDIKLLLSQCLAWDQQDRVCVKSQTCKIKGCQVSHHQLLHKGFPATKVTSAWQLHI